MFEHLRLLLTSSDPATLVGSAAFAVFFIILGWRKFLPGSWNWLEVRIPLVDRIQSDVLWTFAWKAVQTLPGALVGALMVAIASGGDWKKALLGAAAGPVASLGHELLKRYKGQTGVPGTRSIPPPAAYVVLFVALAFHAQACGVFGSGGSFWPTAAKCAPSNSQAINAVADVLLQGGNYESNLEALGKRFGASAVVCIVNSLVADWSAPGKTGASPALVAAKGRGEAFLAKVGTRIQ